MATGTVVNLDALIRRADFVAEEGPDVGESDKKSVSKTDLLKGESFHSSLRKPDFQRETAAWSPEAVRECVKAFVEGDLIPSVICWQSPSRLSFVIDGAHRLSAIMSWLMDDYGDGDISREFYNHKIPPEQVRIHLKTKKLVEDAVGEYKKVMVETREPGTYPQYAHIAHKITHSGINLQWIRGREREKAEKAFYAINQSAVRIDPTELKILNARFKSNAVAARAVVRNATGYKYWKDFSNEGKEGVEKLAKETYELLYSPPLNEPIRSNDLPIAGHGYGSQTLPLIYEMVNVANDLPVTDVSKSKKLFEPAPAEPIDEVKTLQILKNTASLARRVTGRHASSLGLLPAIYFYSAAGRHQPTAVLAVAAFFRDLEKRDKFGDFVRVRSRFEEFLMNHKYYVNQITVKQGSMVKGYKRLQQYYEFVLAVILTSDPGVYLGDSTIERKLTESPLFQSLAIERVTEGQTPRDFSKEAAQFAFLRDSLEGAKRCPVCFARKDSKAMTAGHQIDQKHGGTNAGSNLEFEHPYCNSAKDRISTLSIFSWSAPGGAAYFDNER